MTTSEVQYVCKVLRYYDTSGDLVEYTSHIAKSTFGISAFTYCNLVDYNLSIAQQDDEIICIVFRDTDKRLIINTSHIVLGDERFVNKFTNEVHYYLNIVEYTTIKSPDMLLYFIKTYDTRVFLDHLSPRGREKDYSQVSWKELVIIPTIEKKVEVKQQ